MAVVEARIPAAYANKHAIFITPVVRIVFIDERQNVGRVATTETAVAEIIMTKHDAQFLANDILARVGTAPIPAQLPAPLEE